MKHLRWCLIASNLTIPKTRALWDAAEYVDKHHLSPDMLPIDSEYALSLIEAFMLHHVIELANVADYDAVNDN